MRWIAIGLVLMGATVAGYLLVLVAGAYLTVKTSPREPMELCPKHGPIRRQHMIEFMGQPFCSICFHERLRQAEQSGGR